MDLPDDIQSIVPVPTHADVQVMAKEFKASTQSNLEVDYNFAVTNLRTMIKKGMMAVDGAVALARESESPRMFEAASTFLKCLSDLNKDLVSLSEDQVKKAPKDNIQLGPASAGVTNNTIFVSSSEDLSSLINDRLANTFDAS